MGNAHIPYKYLILGKTNSRKEVSSSQHSMGRNSRRRRQGKQLSQFSIHFSQSQNYSHEDNNNFEEDDMSTYYERERSDSVMQSNIW